MEKKKVINRQKNVDRFTDEDRKEIFKLYHYGRMSLRHIADRYFTNHINIRNVLKRMPLPDVMDFDDSKLIKRKDLDTAARIIAMKEDAITVTEGVIALMGFHVKEEFKRLSTVPGAKAKIPLRELSDFLKEVAPYLLQKADKAPVENKATSKKESKVFTMFNSAV